MTIFHFYHNHLDVGYRPPPLPHELMEKKTTISSPHKSKGQNKRPWLIRFGSRTMSSPRPALFILLVSFLAAVITAEEDTSRSIKIMNESGRRIDIHFIDPQNSEMVLQTDPSALNWADTNLNSFVEQTFQVRELPSKESGICADDTCRVDHFTISSSQNQILFIREGIEVEHTNSQTIANESAAKLLDECRSISKRKISKNNPNELKECIQAYITQKGIATDVEMKDNGDTITNEDLLTGGHHASPTSRLASPPRVAVIGCGPGGMSVLHALAIRRQKLEEAGDEEGLSRLPLITVYERSSSPGGVWKADAEDNSMDSSATGMYEALWTNGPNQEFEYHDYTFDEHFKHPLPVYLPRGPILDYMMKRVTRNNPHFFDSVQFYTDIKGISYHEDGEEFQVSFINPATGEWENRLFDKLIWAAGVNGKPRIPGMIHRILERNGFQGNVIHSSEAGRILGDFKGKRIAMIGDAYSAEDLALQAIKLGVEKIFIFSKRGAGYCALTSEWPDDKVEVIYNSEISGVDREGNGLQLDQRNIPDISAVIYCTGYEANINMMHDSMYDEHDAVKKWSLDLPVDWEMKFNPFSEDGVGDVKPSETLKFGTLNVHIVPGDYRGIKLHNPNLMMLHEDDHLPLLEIDVRAWYFVALLAGEVELPSYTEMENEFRTIVSEGMQDPLIRREIDVNYLDDTWDWPFDFDYDVGQRILSMKDTANEFTIRVLAQEMKDGGYPLDLGSFSELNEKGKLLSQMQLASVRSRSHVPKGSWQTFRDIDPAGFVSLHTGQPAVPLKAHWIDMDDAADPYSLL